MCDAIVPIVIPLETLSRNINLQTNFGDGAFVCIRSSPLRPQEGHPLDVRFLEIPFPGLPPVGYIALPTGQLMDSYILLVILHYPVAHVVT